MPNQKYIINGNEMDKIPSLLGVQDKNLKLLKKLYQTDITYRDNYFFFCSENKEDFEKFKKHIDLLFDCINQNDEINEDKIAIIYHSLNKDDVDSKHYKVIIYDSNNNPVIARNNNQASLIKSIENHDLVFSIGPAGTGKTYLSVAMAVNALKKREVEKIVLTRPAVEAGEKIGFLPGDIKDKIDPYLMPLYDSLSDLLGYQQFIKLLERNVIEIIPLAFMRGRTFNNAFIILDEAQNTTESQMLMFLTRLGKKSKMVVNGDITQIDYPLKKETSGLVSASYKLRNIDEIAFSYLDSKDVVRNPLVQKIIEEYAK